MPLNITPRVLATVDAKKELLISLITLVLKVLTLEAFQIGAVVSARTENRSAPP